MKKIVFRLIVFVGALGLGLTAAFVVSKSRTGYKFDAGILTVALKPRPGFTKSFRGCGMGYVQGYTTSDGIEVTEGTIGCVAATGKDNRFWEAKRRPDRLISQTSERAVAEINEDGKRSFEIYKVTNGTCTHFIGAPTLELALEFEEYLKNHDK